MNRQKMTQLHNFIAVRLDEQVLMDYFIMMDRSVETVAEAIAPSCNTAACIAGWEALRVIAECDPDCLLQSARYIGGPPFTNDIGNRSVMEIAAESLELTPREAQHLFMGLWSTIPDTADYIDEDCDEDICRCDGRDRPFLHSLTKADVLRELAYCIEHGQV